MNWVARWAGDMTVSIVDADSHNFTILKVDMLKAGTMKAGTDGEILCRTMNDLTVLAGLSRMEYRVSADNLPYSECGIDPLPWRMIYDEKKRKVIVRAADGRLVCNRTFPAQTDAEYLALILDTLEKGIGQISLVL